jgi:methylase of polypeptide subunit release factors
MQKVSDNPDLAQLHGIDLTELALVMAATSLRLLDHGGPHDLKTGDFLSLTQEELGTVDAVISNPPYSRHHALDAEFKTFANEQANAETGLEFSSLSPLYAYFYTHSSQFLSESGRMTFITPAEFLETGYGEALKQFLLDDFDMRALVMADRDASLFDEAMTTSCISFLEKVEDSSDATEVTKFIRVDEWPGSKTLHEAIDDGTEGDTSWGYVNPVRQNELDPTDKWTLFSTPSI